MKKIITGGLVILLLFACAAAPFEPPCTGTSGSAPSGITAEDKAAIDAVVNWIRTNGAGGHLSVNQEKRGMAYY